MRFVLNILKKSFQSRVLNDLKIRAQFSICGNLRNKTLDQNITDIDEDLLETNKEYEAFANRYFGCSTYHNCFIIHPYVKWGPQKVRDTNPEKQVKEAVALIRTLAPWKVEDTIIIPLPSFHKKTLFGAGNLEKLRNQIRGNPSITAVFINIGTLKNMQLKELEMEFGVPILDRYKIVMQILRLHAISTHAKLQVALAELPYLRARLRKDDFSIVTSEDYETRKLMLQDREQKLKAAIKKLRSQRQLLRNRRKEMDYPIIAIVGYTNAGKTSLIKALTGDEKLQPKNYLFATLDVTMHAGKLPSTLEVIYVDTVGFISDIPTTLIECFTVTLEDALFADVIVHVEDLSSEDLIYQRNHVLSTLNDLAVKSGSEQLLDRIVTVGNKYDLCPTATPSENSILVSSTTHLGIDTLRQKIEEAVLKSTERRIITIKVPSGSNEMRWLYKNGAVISVTADNENAEYQKIKMIISKSKFEQFKHSFINKR
ncbi:hypothetical protein ILUMI_23142 [Ignelater luminosus]|uniref:Hflx-type G domain-containing protein n=1 Tax=Ignelater luminosus TaxID=2038154 RepID=A0A8K0G250_IGNLU|nr:hypothetical protein ILUMI_23142 [Ignelater luminosus]